MSKHTYPDRSWQMHRTTGWLAIAILALVIPRVGHTQTFDITPLDFGNGLTIKGTIRTDGSRGTLTAGNFTRWNLTVTQSTDIFFNPTNTHASLSQVFSNGSALQVATQPNTSTDGGSLSFLGGRRLGVQVADFTGASPATGGQAYYVQGGNFNLLPLHQPNNTLYTAARSSGGNLFDLVPRNFGNGITMTGTILTDGTAGSLGATNILDWSIRIHEVAVLADLNETNSQLLYSDLVSSDGHMLTVANATPDTPDIPGTPGGHLEFGRFNGFDLTSAQLADFSDITVNGGQAGYFSPTDFQVITPLSSAPQYVVATAAVAPEPATMPLLVVSSMVIAGYFRQKRRPTV